MNRLIARVIGEASSTGTSVRGDQLPKRPEPEMPPRPEDPEQDAPSSAADLRHRESEQAIGEQSDLDTVVEMWRAGSKYDACKYMLFSNFLYTDLIRLIQMLPEGEGLEMGGILDELAPNYQGPEYEPSDMVSAAAGAGLEMPAGGESETPANPAPR